MTPTILSWTLAALFFATHGFEKKHRNSLTLLSVRLDFTVAASLQLTLASQVNYQFLAHSMS